MMRLDFEGEEVESREGEDEVRRRVTLRVLGGQEEGPLGDGQDRWQVGDRYSGREVKGRVKREGWKGGRKGRGGR